GLLIVNVRDHYNIANALSMSLFLSFVFYMYFILKNRKWRILFSLRLTTLTRLFLFSLSAYVLLKKTLYPLKDELLFFYTFISLAYIFMLIASFIEFEEAKEVSCLEGDRKTK
ncbi:MAG: hypothetical protein KDD49_14205, partial [Bacteroidetes bacterium]|nr:hypothetical protein [Bacteroidota bacterium]